jgi:polyisoprenoid-binding protein YceI
VLDTGCEPNASRPPAAAGSVRRGHPVLGKLAFVLASAVATGPSALPLHYRIGTKGSVIRWDLPATLHTVRGRVPAFTGSIDLEPQGDHRFTARGRVTVDARAMETGNSRRDRKMREKVLETDRFPEIFFEFQETEVDLGKWDGGEPITVPLTGQLHVHGRAVAVQLPVQLIVLAEYAVIAGSFPLNWKQYGLQDPSFGLVRVREPMVVSFRLRAEPVELP